MVTLGDDATRARSRGHIHINTRTAPPHTVILIRFLRHRPILPLPALRLLAAGIVRRTNSRTKTVTPPQQDFQMILDLGTRLVLQRSDRVEPRRLRCVVEVKST